MARPTLSLAKYLQQVGRGLRKSDGKDACILIDNVGLYRVFGLPTVSWDWKAMFLGITSGKGKHENARTKGLYRNRTRQEDTVMECGMETVVTHDRLKEMLQGQNGALNVLQTDRNDGMKAWKDRNTGRWGLKLGEKMITEAVFCDFFGIRYGMAAVRLEDGECALVNENGETVWKRDNCCSVYFMKKRFLGVMTTGGQRKYIDLHSLRIYERMPEVRSFGKVEMLKYGNAYYSRTKVTYVNRGNIGCRKYIYRHNFGITIFDDCMGNNGRGWGFACILNNDYGKYYWIYRWMKDGSVIVKDCDGNYYHAKNNGEKVLVGCDNSTKDREKCMEEIEGIMKMTARYNLVIETRKKKERLTTLECNGTAEPFRAGMKWGLKVGERVTVPPIYRNIKSPVGRYCAVEMYYRQWGVISLDGKVWVEPEFENIEINLKGKVTGTKGSGKKFLLKLP